MALVSYSDASDLSDSENEDMENGQQNLKKPVLSNINLEIKKTVQENLPSSITNEEDLDTVNDVPTVKTWNFIKENSSETRPTISKKFKKNKKQKLKLILPALSEFGDDSGSDEDIIDAAPASKRPKASKEGTGLLDLLPQPRVGSSLIPQSVVKSQKNSKPPPKVSLSKKPSCPIKAVNSDDEEDISASDFFSLSDSSVSQTLPPISLDVQAAPAPLISSVPMATMSTNQTVHSTDMPPPLPPVDTTTDLSIDMEMLRRLSGKRGVREAAALAACAIEVRADDALLSREERELRSATEPKAPPGGFSHKKDGMPSHQQRRKHQITFLAHQAKEREVELQQAWSQGRANRAHTQNKYGF